jgi:predicted metal-dependent peptidase
MSNDVVLNNIIDKIITARVGLLLKHPFFGNLATRLTIKESGDWCTTAATDGRHIFFNREFFAPLSIPQIQFVLAHEILHNAFDHFSRRDDRHPKIFNFATDYCVNGQIVRDNIGNSVIDGITILHDTKYYGMGAEEIYDILKDHNDEMLNKLGELLDQHIDWEDGDGAGDKNDPNGRPVYTKEELRQIRSEVTEAVMAAAQASGAGNTPAMIQRMIKELVEPKMNWREILRQQIQSIIKSDYTWMRPSRKAWHMCAVLPGSNVQEAIDICVAIDMSGSITDTQATDFLSEIKGIMQEYQDFKIKLWCFDTEVYNEQDFDGYSMDDFDNYEPMGGGGTDFSVNWKYMNDHDITPKKFIMFTDGYPCGSWGDEDYCDTVFIIHGNDTTVPPFGEYAYYERAGELA